MYTRPERMKPYQKVILGVVGIAAGTAAAFVALTLAMNSGFGSLCANEPLAEVRSPGGARKAVVFQRDCGATTGFSTQLSVLPADGELPDESGNVFVSDTDHGAAPSGPGGGPAVDVAWLGESRIVIRHHPRTRVFRAKPRIGAVEVRYEAR